MRTVHESGSRLRYYASHEQKVDAEIALSEAASVAAEQAWRTERHRRA